MTCLRVAIAALLLLFCPRPAWAATFATIDQITTVDALGRWKPASQTGRVRVVRGDTTLPASVGIELMPGDRLLTDDARARVRLGGGQDISVAEHSDVEVGERSVLQRLGEAYYRVRGSFSVSYGSVQTTVEGTEFAVRVGEATVVSVAEGRVSVRNPDGEVHVRRGQVVEIAQTGTPAAPTFNPAVARAAIGKTFRRAGPSLQAGVLLSGGFANGGGAVEGRLFARILLFPGLRLSIDTGIGSDGVEDGTRLPQGVGLELALGGVSVGGQVLTTVELCNFECGGAYVALHIGGMGWVRYSLPLSRHFSLEGVLRAGYADGIVVDGAGGFGVSL